MMNYDLGDFDEKKVKEIANMIYKKAEVHSKDWYEGTIYGRRSVISEIEEIMELVPEDSEAFEALLNLVITIQEGN